MRVSLHYVSSPVLFPLLSAPSLKAQRPLLQQTESPREFVSLLQETESRLLGEVAGWYSRRSFTGVA